MIVTHKMAIFLIRGTHEQTRGTYDGTILQYLRWRSWAITHKWCLVPTLWAWTSLPPELNCSNLGLRILLRNWTFGFVLVKDENAWFSKHLRDWNSYRTRLRDHIPVPGNNQATDNNQATRFFVIFQSISIGAVFWERTLKAYAMLHIMLFLNYIVGYCTNLHI